MDPLCVAVIDTPQFQRLRQLKQLGVGYLVFPSACHNRFEHSIGTSHLAGRVAERLRSLQPELGITATDVLCLQLAGLCHDLGHGPFSHTFELHVNEQRPVGARAWSHEEASTAMFDHLVTQNGLLDRFAARGLGDTDRLFIKELMVGVPPDAWAEPATAPRGRPSAKSFLYEIVANKRNGVDVDKWDYFCRDSMHLNIKASFDHERYLLSVRVLEGPDGLRQICPRDKEVESVYSLWSTRSRLHRTAYQHKTSKVLERMLLEILRAAEPHLLIPGAAGKLFTMSAAVADMKAYSKLTDAVLSLIAVSTDPGLAVARRLLDDLQCRRLYKFVGKAQPGDSGTAARLVRSELPMIQREIAACAALSSRPIDPADIALDLIKITHGPGRDDPIRNLRFWSKDDPGRTFQISPKEVSHMLPAHSVEHRLCVYSKRRDRWSKPALTEAFGQWCDRNDFEFQASPLEPARAPSPTAPVTAARSASQRHAIPFDPDL